MGEKIKESIGYCEGLCGGLLSHHLVDGLCPDCQCNPKIETVSSFENDYSNVPLGVESDVQHVLNKGGHHR